MKTRLILLGCGLLAAALLVLGGCSALGGGVKIGVAVPLTGDQALQGQQILNAVHLAVDQWNAKGGVLGKKITVVKANDEGNAKMAKQVARSLSGSVTAVIGHYNSACTLAAEELYYSSRTLMVTPSSTNPAITDKGYPTIFRVCGRDDQQGSTAAQYVVKHFPDARVALIQNKSAYGEELSNEFLRNYEYMTKKESVYYKGIDASDTDFAPIVKALQEKKPTIIYYGGLFHQGAALLKAVRQAGIDATFVSGDGCYDPEFISQAGAQNAEGALCTFYPDHMHLASAKEMVDAYRKAYHSEPGPYSMFAYIATQVVLQGIQKAQTTDSLKVAKVMHSMTFKTPIGPFKFNAKGDPEESPYVMWEVESGKFVPVSKLSENQPAPSKKEAPEPKQAVEK